MTKTYSQHDISKACDFIKKFEGLRLKAYRCSAGVLTIGYGHTADVSEHDEITADQAADLLEKDVKSVVASLSRFVNRSVTEGQFIALTSLAFNIGVNGVVSNCPSLMRALNSKHDLACAKEFLDVCTADGQMIKGLVKRRIAEIELFLEI